MGPKNLTDQEKARILAYHEENVSVKEICRRTGKGKTAVYSLISRAKCLPPRVSQEDYAYDRQID